CRPRTSEYSHQNSESDQRKHDRVEPHKKTKKPFVLHETLPLALIILLPPILAGRAVPGYSSAVFFLNQLYCQTVSSILVLSTPQIARISSKYNMARLRSSASSWSKSGRCFLNILRTVDLRGSFGSSFNISSTMLLISPSFLLRTTLPMAPP